jgi:hypothetical protein
MNIARCSAPESALRAIAEIFGEADYFGLPNAGFLMSLRILVLE